VREPKQAGEHMHVEQETLSYEPPAVVEIGSIADLTQGAAVTNVPDNGTLSA
jgi:hypothetical protein